jgi:hypothetical protein
LTVLTQDGIIKKNLKRFLSETFFVFSLANQ